MKKPILYFLLFLSQISMANVILPSVFSDHMVLQQNDEVKFWGWANPNEEITIKPSWTNEVFKTKTSNQAKWELIIKTPNYGGPFTISIKGYNEIILKDILIGEVWLCSGQSNMEMSASWGIKNMDEIEKANNSNIRFFNVPKVSAISPQNNLTANWQVSNPETMKYSSAIAYFFAKRIQEEYKDIPVGLIISAWGGTPAEIWMPEEIIKNDATVNEAASQLKPVEWGPTEPARAFNAMINPLVGYNVAGTLWYQGESNVGAKNYDKTFSALINSWRTLWNKKFPFYFVQIAPYKYGEDHFGGAEIRNAQRIVSKNVDKTEMVVTSDISTIDDIHPKDKKTVGVRLANLALKNHYKKIIGQLESPEIDKINFIDNRVILQFKNSKGLCIKSKNSLFEIANEDKVFFPAEMKMKGEKIQLSSKEVKTPKYVRFAWKNIAQSNVFNGASLPLSTFTTEF